MSNRNVIVLSIVAAITLIWAVIQSHVANSNANRPQRASFEESYLIQGLDLASIASIRIGTGDDALTLVRQGPQFVVASKQGYPADTEKINRLLIDLTDLRVTELVTDDEENHESLHVTEDNVESLVRFFDQSDTLMTGIAIGSRHIVEGGTGPSQSYVRLLSSSNVFLAQDAPSVEDSAIEYLDRNILDLEGDEIAQVEVSLPDSSYQVKAGTKDDTAKYVLNRLPEGRELDDTKAGELFSAFASVTLQDVQKAEKFEEGLTPVGTAVCTLKNQVAYSVEVFKKDDTPYVRISAESLDKTQIVKEDRVETDEELKAKEAKLLARDEAEKFTQRHQGWMYEIPKWKADKLLTARNNLLKEIETPDEIAPASGSEAIPSVTN